MILIIFVILIIVVVALVNANPKASNSETSLVKACEKGNAEEVRSMLEAGADANTKDKYGGIGIQSGTVNKRLCLMMS